MKISFNFVRMRHWAYLVVAGCVSAFSLYWMVRAAGVPGASLQGGVLGGASLLVFYLALALLTACPLSVLGVVGVVAAGLFKVHEIKLRELGQPLFLSDYHFLSSVLTEISGVSGYVSPALVFGCVAILGGVGIVFLGEIRCLRGRWALQRRHMVVTGTLLLVLTGAVVGVPMFRDGLLSALSVRFNVFQPSVSVHTHGLISHLICSMSSFSGLLPEIDGDPAIIREQANYYTAKPPAARPHVVVVLRESVFDPRVLDLPWRDDVFRVPPDVHRLAEGALGVRVFGGTTLVSEFEFLTGLPVDLFGRRGTYPHFTLAHPEVPSLARELRRFGYRSVALYPTGGELFNARNAYRLYGFDAFEDSNSLNLRRYKYKSWAELRDEYMYEEVLRLMRDSNEPLFVFLLTLSTHGPYSDEARGPEGVKKYFVERPLLSNDNLRQLLVFLDRLQLANEDYAEFKVRLQDQDRDVVLVSFGDHLPRIGSYIQRTPDRESAGQLKLFETVFEFWATGADYRLSLPSDGPLDISFLPGALLDALRMNDSVHFGANSIARRAANGRYDLTSPVINSYRAHAQQIAD